MHCQLCLIHYSTLDATPVTLTFLDIIFPMCDNPLDGYYLTVEHSISVGHPRDEVTREIEKAFTLLSLT